MSDRLPWERLEGETGQAYAAFRRYRDVGLLRRIDTTPETVPRSAQRWAAQHDWAGRARAWDDAAHQADDAERLEAIRSMHANHQRAGRAAMRKALQALEVLDVRDMNAAQAARLLELGARLERQILLTSVEDLQGVDDEPLVVINGNDPWERIARELAGA